MKELEFSSRAGDDSHSDGGVAHRQLDFAKSIDGLDRGVLRQEFESVSRDEGARGNFVRRGRDEEIGEQRLVDPDFDGLAKGKHHHRHADRHRDRDGERGDRDRIAQERTRNIRRGQLGRDAAARAARTNTAQEFARCLAEMEHDARHEKGESGEDQKRGAEAEPARAGRKRQIRKDGREKNAGQSADQPGRRRIHRALQPGSAVQRLDRLLFGRGLGRKPRGGDDRAEADRPGQRKVHGRSAISRTLTSTYRDEIVVDTAPISNRARITPPMSPRKEPIAPRTIASARNSIRISFRVTPNERRIPISCWRRTTEAETVL